MKKYEDYLNIYKKDISDICKLECKNHSKSKIEYEDLFQEATIKLFEIFQSNKAMFKSYTLKSITNRIKNLYRKENKDLLSKSQSIGLIVWCL